MMDKQVEFSKKGQRQISEFMGFEFLYDYVSGNLTADRIEVVRKFLQENDAAKAEYKKIQSALDYLSQISKTTVADEVVTNIRQPSSYFDVLVRKIRFEEWPEGLKMGIEVLVVAIGVVSFALVVPWHKLLEVKFADQRPLILAEIEKQKLLSPTEIPDATQDTATVFPDEGSGEKEKPKLEVVQAPVPTPAPIKKQEASPAPSTVVNVPTVVAIAPQAQPESQAKKLEDAKVTKSTDQEKRQGFLYRGEIDVTNVTVVTMKFVDQISELGGRKAGQVPLGWAKGTSTYFHFTMPEAKYQNFLDFAKEYGEFKVQKEKHDRIMPDGIMRIIITINEKK